MQPVATFRDYFEAELGQLREQAVDFGRDYPATAQALALGQGRSGDPHVELLLQSFAFLAGRLRHQLDRDATVLPNALMAQLYPHLEAPIPSLLVAELTPKPDASYAKPVKLEKGREFNAIARDEAGRTVRCRLSAAFDVPLVPVTIDDIRQVSTTAYDGLSGDPSVHSVLKLQLSAPQHQKLSDLALDTLRFYIDIENSQCWRIYELLSLQLAGIATLDENQQLRRQSDKSLRWLGFRDEEAALATDLVTHPGYRLVQEYFAFPEKFLFFELSGLDFSSAGNTTELLLLLRSTVDKTLDPGKRALRLNCAPLINLFQQRIEPVALDQSRYEYKLSADYANHRYTEIYRIDALTAVRPGEPPRPVSPYFALDGFDRLEQQDYFYVTRREESDLRSVPGTETYVSFLDMGFNMQRPSDEAIGGRALCTNRRLAEQLCAGDKLNLEGSGPVQATAVASKPTPHQTPALLGRQPWALISQLLLNHLPLTGGPQGLGALKSMLRLHLGRATLLGAKQIDSITGLTVQPMVRAVTRAGRRQLIEGLHIDLKIDRQRFEGSSPVLFAEVLRRFFALFASVNMLTELSLETHDVKGKLKTWPPMAGEQIVL